MELYIRKEALNTQKLLKCYGQLKNTTPEELSIPMELALDSKTFEYLQQKQLLEKVQQLQKSRHQSEDQTCASLPSTRISEYQQKAQPEPYITAINQLKSLSDNYYTPKQKLQCILLVAEEIGKTLESFYSEFQQEMDHGLDPDETLQLFIFVTIKAQITDILAQLSFIEAFTSQNLMNSTYGYYFVTLQASTNYIMTPEKDKTQLQHFKDSVVSIDLMCSLKK